MDGTYPLPEAQLDRFLMKTTIGYPHQRAEFEILKGAHEGHRVSDVTQVATADDVRGLINSARRVHVADAILDYIADLVATTRTMNELALGSSPRVGSASCAPAGCGPPPTAATTSFRWTCRRWPGPSWLIG